MKALVGLFEWLVTPSYLSAEHRASEATADVVRQARAVSDTAERTVMRWRDHDATVASLDALSRSWNGVDRRRGRDAP